MALGSVVFAMKSEAFSRFLEASSMHGLRYLSTSRNPWARLLWLAAIGSCVASAAAIIYLNVANWNNSPAVVTTVRPAPVEEST